MLGGQHTADVSLLAFSKNGACAEPGPGRRLPAAACRLPAVGRASGRAAPAPTPSRSPLAQGRCADAVRNPSTYPLTLLPKASTWCLRPPVLTHLSLLYVLVQASTWRLPATHHHTCRLLSISHCLALIIVAPHPCAGLYLVSAGQDQALVLWDVNERKVGGAPLTGWLAGGWLDWVIGYRALTSARWGEVGGAARIVCRQPAAAAAAAAAAGAGAARAAKHAPLLTCPPAHPCPPLAPPGQALEKRLLPGVATGLAWHPDKNELAVVTEDGAPGCAPTFALFPALGPVVGWPQKEEAGGGGHRGRRAALCTAFHFPC